MPSDTCRFAFLRALLAADPDGLSAILFHHLDWNPKDPANVAGLNLYLPGWTLPLIAARRGPLRVLALVRVRWPRAGSPLRWRTPR